MSPDEIYDGRLGGSVPPTSVLTRWIAAQGDLYVREPRCGPISNAYFEVIQPCGAPAEGVITVERMATAALVADLAVEFALIAHEIGHYQSWKSGTPATVFQGAHDMGALRAAPLDERRRFFEEEERAWRLAREVLTQLGLTKWVEFDCTATEKLWGYRSGLRL